MFGLACQSHSNDLFSYIPGWDCHGLPIENKALQELGVIEIFMIYLGNPKAIHNVLPLAYRLITAHWLSQKFARQLETLWNVRSILVQKAEFQQLGIMADWTSQSGCYRTMGWYANVDT